MEKSSKSGNVVGCFVAQVQRSVKQTFLSCCRFSSCVANCLRQISSCSGIVCMVCFCFQSLNLNVSEFPFFS